MVNISASVPANTEERSLGAQRIREANEAVLVEHNSDGTHKAVSVSVSAPATPAVKTLYEDSIIKAWLVQGGSATPTITDDLNISSITDTGVGQRSPVFATAMSTGNYAISVVNAGAAATTARIASVLGTPATTGFSYIQQVVDSFTDPSEADHDGWAIVVGNN